MTVDRPPRSTAIAGGFRQSANDMRVTESFRLDADTWAVYRHPVGVSSSLATAVVMCLEVTPCGTLTVAKKGVKAAQLKRRGK